MDRHTGGFRDRISPLCWFQSLLWDISSRFLLANFSELPGSESIWYISGPSRVCQHLSAKMDASEKPMVGWYHSPFDLQEIFQLGGSPWPWEWEICGLLSSIWAGPSLFSRLSYYWYFGVFYPQETNSNGLGVGVPYLPLASDGPQILQFLESWFFKFGKQISYFCSAVSMLCAVSWKSQQD